MFVSTGKGGGRPFPRSLTAQDNKKKKTSLTFYEHLSCPGKLVIRYQVRHGPSFYQHGNSGTFLVDSDLDKVDVLLPFL